MDDLLLRYMNASDEPTANEAAAALSAALRRKQDLGTLGVLSGGALAQPGSALLGAAGNDGQGLMHAQVARTARLDRKSAQEIAGLKDLRDFEARAKEQALDNERADRGQVLQADNNRIMQQLASSASGRQIQDSALAEAARTRLGEGTISGLAALPVAEGEVDKVVEAFNRLNMGGAAGRAGSAVTGLFGLQNTDSAEFNAVALQAMQAAGKILEEGKLQAGDELKYKRMLPQAGDSEDVLKTKATGLKSYLRELASRKAKGLKDAGYAVPQSLDPTAGQTPANDEHAQALAWAKANPNDPRAKKILQLNGGK